jgi:cytochrome c oxidase accessory protein FixG
MAVSNTPVKPTSGAAPSLPPPNPGWTYHRIRKTVHLVCFLIFCALPFFNVMRFDIPRQRFYFAGYELWINEFAIIFFVLMFLMFLIVASSIVYGRIYCGYACPQMIFSEASITYEKWLKRRVTKKFSNLSQSVRTWMVRAGFYAGVGAASVVLAFVFISYFVEPRDLLNRLMHLDMQTAGGISGAVVTLITFLDFTLVRQTFCVTVCPYGYLQGMLGDDNTLLVNYVDENKVCIECKKCIRVCEMGIDIRKSPLQIECVHCGECIDACYEIMTKVKKPALIHYTWGPSGKPVETGNSWYRKMGIRDAKRVVVLLVTLFYLSGIFVALSMRRAVLVQLMPERGDSLYTTDAATGAVANTFRLKMANRSKNAANVTFSAEGLAAAGFTLAPSTFAIQPGESLERRFTVSARPFPGAQDVNHFNIVARADSTGEQETFAETFLMPPERKTP